ncbi:MAG: response regulator [Phycisphaeraceae bacterium]|nr:response regulator [Phycisphaeraceae bacterium]
MSASNISGYNVCLKGLAAEFEHPGGGVARRQVDVHWFSADSLHLTLRGYLHQGSICRIELPTFEGTERIIITGMIVSCRHAEGDRHEALVAFDQKVDPRDFLPELHPSARDQGEKPPAELLEIDGDILLLDDQEAIGRLTAHHLRQTRLQTVAVSQLTAAEAIIKERPLRLVICDLELEGIADQQVIRPLREAGYYGPILGLSGKSIPPAAVHDVAYILTKPFTAKELYGAILEVFRKTEGAKSQGPIDSPLRHDPAAQPLLDWYLPRLRELMIELRKAMATVNTGEALRICQVLRETGGGFGYAVVSVAARQLAERIEASGSTEECAVQMEVLENICRRLR